MMGKENNNMKKLVTTIILIFSLPTALCSEETATAPEERPPVLFSLGVRFYGVSVMLGYRGLTAPPNPDTILWLIAGAGYDGENFFRDSSNHLYEGGGGFDDDDVGHAMLDGLFYPGVAQGFIYNDRLQCNLLEAFFFYKMKIGYVIDNPDKGELILASGLPDAAGFFQNSLLTGLSFNDLNKTDPHRTQQGVYAEVSAEWAPAFLFNTAYGRADFIRLNLTASGFLPVFDIDPRAELNKLSGYLGGFFAVDWCGGGYIPINVQQSFGGRSARAGLGGAVRGYEGDRFDGPFKAVLNAEFRLNLPQFKIIDVLTPGLFAFFDSGYYNYIYYDEQGFLFSTGIGVSIDVWKLMSLNFYIACDLSRPQLNGNWTSFVFTIYSHF
jgi:hypothetical protein